ncbi:MAG: universal stress protein [Gemmatimonadaceae bacterium]
MFAKLIVPLDNSPLAEQALPTAEALAQRTGGEIELVYVHEPRAFAGYADAPWNAARRSLEDSYICAMADETRAGSGVPVHGGIATGRPADAICARARQTRADLIVMTSHGRTGLSRAWLGSVADSVIRQAAIPVLLLRPQASISRAKLRPAFARVLVPLDGSAVSELILGPAAALAAANGGRLILLEIVRPVPLMVPDAALAYSAMSSVADPEATQKAMLHATSHVLATARRLAANGITNVETHVVVNDAPAQAIIDATRVQAADIVAMTTSGAGTSRVVVGSVADKVMRAVQLPLLLYRPNAIELDEAHFGLATQVLQPSMI